MQYQWGSLIRPNPTPGSPSQNELPDDLCFALFPVDTAVDHLRVPNGVETPKTFPKHRAAFSYFLKQSPDEIKSDPCS